MNFDNLTLRNQICFTLYNATNSIVRYYNPLLSKHGLTKVTKTEDDLIVELT